MRDGQAPAGCPQACRELRELRPRGHTPSLPLACSRQVRVPLRHALLPRSNPGWQQREEQDRAAITQGQAHWPAHSSSDTESARDRVSSTGFSVHCQLTEPPKISLLYLRS